MEFDFYILDPTGNITAIVETPVMRESQSCAARLIMDEYPQVEQVAFIEPRKAGSTDIAIRMMGGEFCGNAAICAASLLMSRCPDEEASFRLEISGAEKPLTAKLRADGELYIGSVEMPLPRSVDEISLSFGEKSYSFPRVSFDGITHLIAMGNIEKTEALSAISGWCRELNTDALGILFCEGDAMTPLVYVGSTDSRVWEGSCASGTCAIAAYKAIKSKGSISVDLSEPGGNIGADAVYADGKLRSLKLRNKVMILGHFKLNA